MREMCACLTSGSSAVFSLGLRDVELCFVLLEAFDLTAVNIYKCLKQ